MKYTTWNKYQICVEVEGQMGRLFTQNDKNGQHIRETQRVVAEFTKINNLNFETKQIETYMYKYNFNIHVYYKITIIRIYCSWFFLKTIMTNDFWYNLLFVMMVRPYGINFKE